MNSIYSDKAPDSPTFSYLTLEYGVQLRSSVISDPNLVPHSFNQYETERELVRTLDAWLLRHINPTRIVFESPKSWWDHLRLALAPKWVNKKWPPTMRVERVEVSDIELPKYKLPDDGWSHYRVAIRQPAE